MRFGKSHSVTAPNRPTAIYRRLFGSEEFHSHFRWNAVRRYVDPYAKRTLEVGCGDGAMTIEVTKINPNIVYASEFAVEEVALAQLVVDAMNLNDRVHISQRDLRELNSEDKFDQILAIDVLEHIDDDALALRQINDAMSPGGRFIVSVPTPLYPNYFGREHADRIGHVRDGYWLEDVQPKLEAAGFEVRDHHYYTGPAVSRFIGYYYSPRSPAVEYARALFQPLIRPALMLSERRERPRQSCSLALLAVKTQDA